MIKKSNINENYAGKNGGALYSIDQDDLYIQDSVFKQNQALEEGAGIYILEGNLVEI